MGSLAGNEQKKEVTEKINELAKNFINDPVLVLSGKNWHEGILGIIASRIKEKYNKPTVLISLDNENGKGSARSIFGFDIGSLIINAVQKKILKKGGGHKMAGGFLIDEENINIFRSFLIKNFNKSHIATLKNANVYLDSAIAPSALNEKFYEDVYSLSPFGPGNSEPRFVVENLKLISSYYVGGKHIKSILIGTDGSIIKGFAWDVVNSPLEPFLNAKYKKLFHIAGRMKKNEWKGKMDIEFIIDDISLS